VTPAILPLFVAAGSGVAMVVTFVGFRWSLSAPRGAPSRSALGRVMMAATLAGEPQ